MIRCPWVDLTKPDYVRYHDEEWGVPVYNDRVLFEFLVLESAQAGLSWYTVLRKRENYRQAFAGFDPAIVAGFSPEDVERLLQNPGIIRNRRKIQASIINARCFLDIQTEFGSFASYLWRFVNDKPIQHELTTLSDYPVTTPESDALAKDLKKRGFSFLGSTACYAFMQSVGLVNDHVQECHCRQKKLARI